MQICGVTPLLCISGVTPLLRINGVTPLSIHWYGVVKAHVIACSVIKTIPNNHPSGAAYDTETQKHDIGTVDLENSYWNSMGGMWAGTSNSLLLMST